jgi:small ubiquitin-related modifier
MADAASTEHINLKVTSQNGEEVHFKIKKTTPLAKLMDTYCQRMGLSRNSIRFLFEGSRLQDQQTPKELEMEDGDSIDAMLEQLGGSF